MLSNLWKINSCSSHWDACIQASQNWPTDWLLKQWVEKQRGWMKVTFCSWWVRDCVYVGWQLLLLAFVLPLKNNNVVLEEKKKKITPRPTTKSQSNSVSVGRSKTCMPSPLDRWSKNKWQKSGDTQTCVTCLYVCVTGACRELWAGNKGWQSINVHTHTNTVKAFSPRIQSKRCKVTLEAGHTCTNKPAEILTRYFDTFVEVAFSSPAMYRA